MSARIARSVSYQSFHHSGSSDCCFLVVIAVLRGEARAAHLVGEQRSRAHFRVMDLLGAYASDSDEQDAKKCALLRRAR